MRKVAIVGVGQTPVREHWDQSLRQLAVKALWNAMEDAGTQNVDGLFVGNMLSGPLSDQEHLGSLIADYAALDDVEAIKVEAACGSGAAALRQAVWAVGCGQMESAAVVGVEKLTELGGRLSSHALATAADADYESAVGLSFVAINALLMRRYMHEYGVAKDDFSIFTINAHRNAVHNPNAMFRNEITAQQYAKAKMIADPINLLDSSPIADGAAALVVVPLEFAKRYSGKATQILACEIGMDTIALHDRSDFLHLKGVERSVSKALKTARIERKDIDLLELHDAFSIISALALESGGFADRGRALDFAEKAGIGITGKLPLTTMGGLKGRGHPVGATGTYQLVEAVTQLRGEAPGPIQVDGANTAMVQNIGGSGATIVTTILGKQG